MLDEMIILIRFKGATVGEIIETLMSDNRLCDLTFLHIVSKNYENGLGFGEAWETAAADFSANGLKPADQKLIVNIGKNLGTTDTEGQLSSLSLYQNEAETAYAEAEADTLRKAKLYTSMGILTGAFLIVFLS
jgi:stage III sporulation protein AB